MLQPCSSDATELLQGRNFVKGGLKMREWRFRDYLARKFPIGGGAMSLTPLPPSPRESATLVHIFCLTGREWSLTCWAKIWGEHWSCPVETQPSLCLEKRFCFGGIINPLLIAKLALSIWMNVCLFWLHLTLRKVGKKNLVIIQPSCLFHAFRGYLLLPGDISFLLHKIMYM